jgi:hypothetical protein
MVKGKKLDAKGKEKTHKGVPVIGWIPYAADEPAAERMAA